MASSTSRTSRNETVLNTAKYAKDEDMLCQTSPHASSIEHNGTGMDLTAIDAADYDFAFGPLDTTGASSPCQSTYPTSSHPTGMPDWGNAMNFDPLSPPDSALYTPSKEWSLGLANTQIDKPSSGNVLSDMQINTSMHGPYGQITPPQDDDKSDRTGSQSHKGSGSRRSHSDAVKSNNVEDPSSPMQTGPASATRRKKQRAEEQQQTSDTGTTSSRRSQKHKSRTSREVDESDMPTDGRRSKFLERNRVAASKCREKKKEWTGNLENRARDLQKNNSHLRMMIDSIRQEVLFLQGECKKHSTCDCTQIQQFVNNTTHTMQDPTSYFKHEPTSPTDSLQSSRPGQTASHSEQSVDGFDIQNFSEADKSALEALLTSSIEHDTSEAGISSKVRDMQSQ